MSYLWKFYFISKKPKIVEGAINIVPPALPKNFKSKILNLSNLKLYRLRDLAKDKLRRLSSMPLFACAAALLFSAALLHFYSATFLLCCSFLVRRFSSPPPCFAYEVLDLVYWWFATTSPKPWYNPHSDLFALSI